MNYLKKILIRVTIIEILHRSFPGSIPKFSEKLLTLLRVSKLHFNFLKCLCTYCRFILFQMKISFYVLVVTLNKQPQLLKSLFLLISLLVFSSDVLGRKMKKRFLYVFLAQIHLKLEQNSQVSQKKIYDTHISLSYNI